MVICTITYKHSVSDCGDCDQKVLSASGVFNSEIEAKAYILSDIGDIPISARYDADETSYEEAEISYEIKDAYFSLNDITLMRRAFNDIKGLSNGCPTYNFDLHRYGTHVSFVSQNESSVTFTVDGLSFTMPMKKIGLFKIDGTRQLAVVDLPRALRDFEDEINCVINENVKKDQWLTL